MLFGSIFFPVKIFGISAASITELFPEYTFEFDPEWNVSYDYPDWAVPDATQTINDLSYRVHEVLPYEQDRQASLYLVIPKAWVVLPILLPVPEDKQQIDAWIMFDHFPYLQRWWLWYYGTRNKVIAAHSSYKSSDSWRYKTVWQAFVVLRPWDKVFFYYKNKWWTFDFAEYTVTKSARTTMDDISITTQDTDQFLLTAYSCYPLWSNDDRWYIQSRLTREIENHSNLNKKQIETIIEWNVPNDETTSLPQKAPESQWENSIAAGDKNNQAANAAVKSTETLPIEKWDPSVEENSWETAKSIEDSTLPIADDTEQSMWESNAPQSWVAGILDITPPIAPPDQWKTEQEFDNASDQEITPSVQEHGTAEDEETISQNTTHSNIWQPGEKVVEIETTRETQVAFSEADIRQAKFVAYTLIKRNSKRLITSKRLYLRKKLTLHAFSETRGNGIIAFTMKSLRNLPQADPYTKTTWSKRTLLEKIVQLAFQ